MPRCRSALCACAKARAKVRAAELGSWYFWASARAVSRESAMPVANDSRTKPPGARRMRWRRLTMGSSTTPVVPDRERPSRAWGSSGRAPAAEEARAVRLPLERALRAALQAQDVHGPERRLVGRARPTTAQERRSLREVLRLDEQLSESGVGQVVRRRGEHDLGVARDLDLAGAVAVVRHRQPPHLDVVLGRDRDVEQRGDAVVAAAERRLLGEERHQVVLRLASHRVVGGRPHRPAAHVPQVDELASRIARRVLAVARHDPAPAEAGAAAGVRHDRGVAAVRQELGVRPQRVRRAEAAQGLRGRRAGRACLLDRARLGDRGVARHPLLQQQLRGLHARIGVEALHHRVAEQHVGERDERHALVVGHEGPHDGSAGRAAASRPRPSSPTVACV